MNMQNAAPLYCTIKKIQRFEDRVIWRCYGRFSRTITRDYAVFFSRVYISSIGIRSFQYIREQGACAHGMSISELFRFSCSLSISAGRRHSSNILLCPFPVRNCVKHFLMLFPSLSLCLPTLHVLFYSTYLHVHALLCL